MTNAPIDRESVEQLIKKHAENYHKIKRGLYTITEQVPLSVETVRFLRALFDAKEAAEAKIDACKVYLKDHQDPADRLAQNHREICSLLEMLAKDRKRAEAAEAKLAVAVEAMREVDERANRTYRARNGKMCSIEADDGEACEIVHSDALFQLRATLAQIKPKEGTDNDG